MDMAPHRETPAATDAVGRSLTGGGMASRRREGQAGGRNQAAAGGPGEATVGGAGGRRDGVAAGWASCGRAWAASADCSSALTGLAGCLPYITPGAAPGKPPKECCAGVKAALASPASVACLCDAFGKDYGVPMNLTRAKGLPAACGGNPAALSNCSLKLPGGAPNGAPTEAPSPTSGSTPATVSPSPAKSAATRSPVSAATLVLAAVAAPLLSYYYL